MRVEIRECFEGAQLRDVERLYMLDDEFNRTTFEQMGYGRRILENVRDGDRLDRCLRLCPRTSLPAPFASLIPDGAFQITERVQYDLAQHRGTWRTTPSVLAKQFDAHGTLWLEQRERSVLFHLEGEAKASIPLLGRRAERQAVATAETQHAALARAIRARLDASHATLVHPT